VRPLSDSLIEISPYTLNLTEHVVYRDGEPLELTVKEYQLMEILMQNSGKVISRESLLSRIWGLDGEVTNNSLDSLVKLLRKKLEKDTRLQIRNVRGVGYRLEVSDD
jgi:two-component system OmpR family response regulator